MTATEKQKIIDLVLQYSDFKSNQDIEGALSCCTVNPILDCPSLGTTSRSADQFRMDLTRFYKGFPDFRFIPGNISLNDTGTEVTVIGQTQMTWSGFVNETTPRLNKLIKKLYKPRLIDIRSVAHFEITEGLISRENFTIDLIEMQKQTKIPPKLLQFLSTWSGSYINPKTPKLPPIIARDTAVINTDIDHLFKASVMNQRKLLDSNLSWVKVAKDITLPNSNKLEKGAIRRVHFFHRTMDEEIITFKEPHYVSYTILNGWGKPFDWSIKQSMGEHDLYSVGNQTRFTWTGRFEANSIAHWPVVYLYVRFIVKPWLRRFNKALRNDYALSNH